MYQLLLIIAIIVCVLLVLIVLIQNPKGGGLSSNFSSSSQLMGVQKTGDFLEKGTWGLAIILIVLSMAINVAVKGGTQTTVNKFKEQTEGASKPVTPAAAPVSFPAQTPANNQPAPAQKGK
ncbi:preprotein translocase subunit SecG [Mucilaginibacter gotjawali]|uniref:Protein-export membrane protein SecG n=2 Tax=Mucilaginibacter gotjawali TaxID=1550579 RepID=A0A0X8XA33_9SPHI|nr:preprotein translocase subunit SecG [Mucilaginibacter gotjawali]MBB3055257.1 preprotein translocase subunit SecG [Mucilaginibacter gotjawali]BAU56124.1 preprotein translocase subunit SecG [Mucilaginibacter gotjawali]